MNASSQNTLNVYLTAQLEKYTKIKMLPRTFFQVKKKKKKKLFIFCSNIILSS